MVSKHVVDLSEESILNFFSRFVTLQSQPLIFVFIYPINNCLKDPHIVKEDLEEINSLELAEKTSIVYAFNHFLKSDLLLKAN